MKCVVFVLFVAVIAMAFGSSEIARDPRCLQPMRTGRCLALFYKYGYDPAKNECVKFVYGGCDGNENRFYSKEYCEQICMPNQTRPGQTAA